MLAKEDRRRPDQIESIIAVASGKGGVGKSTTAVNLALALALAGHQVGLLDGDIYGPNQLQMLGLPSTPSQREVGQALSPLTAYGLQVISMACFMQADQPAIWRGPMASKALQQLFYETKWQRCDYLIIDLPPGTGDIVLTLAQKFPIDGVVIVTTPQDVALADVRRAVMMFRKVAIQVVGVVENMSDYQCPNCSHQSYPFGRQGGERLAQDYDLPLLAQLPLDAAICQYSDQGKPVVIADPQSLASQRYHQLAANLLRMMKDALPPV